MHVPDFSRFQLFVFFFFTIKVNIIEGCLGKILIPLICKRGKEEKLMRTNEKGLESNEIEYIE